MQPSILKLLVTTGISTAILGATIQAHAGAANADLKCRAANGLAIEGSVPGDFADFSLQIKKGHQSAQVANSDGSSAQIQVVSNLKLGVWTLVASDANGGYIQMYAVPKTVRYTETTDGFKARFDASVTYGSLKGMTDSMGSKAVVCSLDYSI